MFADDFAVGIVAELRVLKDLQDRYPEARKIEGYHSEFDIDVPGRFTVEVKFDPASKRTGNIVVEYFHRNVSGLHKSTADWWVFDTGDERLWLTKSAVHQCIFGGGHEPVKIKGPQDRFSKWVFLLPIAQIRECSSSMP